MEDTSFGRILSVLTAPAKTFRSIAERPTALVAILVITVLVAGVSFLTFTKVDGEELVRAQLEKSGQELTEEQMESSIAFGEKMKYVGPAAVVIIVPLFTVVAAAIFLVAFKVQGSEIDFRRSLSTYTYAGMPGLVKALLTVPVVLSRPEISAEAAQSGAILMSNLAFLADDDTSAATMAALTSADVFSVWIVALLAMGFATVGKVSKGAATATVLVVWLAGVALKVGLASLGG